MIAKPPFARFIGCDVGKAGIVVFDSASACACSVPNQPEALDALAARLDDTCLVVCEATGGYEAALLAAMLRAGRAVHRADARKVKSFIRSFGTLGKTDAIDARALARYGAERHAQLRRWQAPDAARDRLAAMVLTRRDLVDQRLACNNRLTAPGAQAVQSYLKALLDCLDTQIRAIEADTKALIAAHDALAPAVRALKDLSGIGSTIATALVALMPELGTMNRRQAAALAGLAPHPCQSGSADGYRRTKGGRPEIKKVLFMAALTASRRDPKLSAFYQRLIKAGKKPIVATTAVMRKLIIICNAVLRPKPASADA
jgi:transposase